MSWETAASADGSRIAIVHGNPFSSPRAELEAIDTARGDAVVLGLADWPEGMALSADGGRLAVVAAGVCQVLELPSLRLLASARVPSEGRWAYAPLFVSADRVRLHPLRMDYRTAAEAARSPREITDPAAAEIDVPTKSVSTLGRYPIAAIPFRSVKPAQGLPAEPYFQLHAGPDLSRILVVAFGAARSVRLLDASTGSVLASFDGPEGAANPAACFLADGRAVVADWVPDGRRLVVLSPQGERLSEIALPAPTARIRLGYEPAPGLLAVGIEDAGRKEEWGWSLVELASGRSRPLAVEPLHREWWSVFRPFPPPVPPPPAWRSRRVPAASSSSTRSPGRQPPSPGAAPPASKIGRVTTSARREARRVLEIEAAAIRSLADSLDDGFDTAVALLHGTTGRVVVTGIGKSGIVGQKIAATLASTGTPAFFLHPSEAIHGDLGMILAGDVVLALSHSGESAEIVALLPHVRRRGAKLVALTGRRESTLGKEADAVVEAAIHEEACPLNLAPTASTAAQLAMGDALAMALSVEKGFRPEDFAALHPGGKLGKRFLKVGDLMHSGADLPSSRSRPR